jgi:hypothetical protein
MGLATNSSATSPAHIWWPRPGTPRALILKLVAIPPGGTLLGAPYRWVMPWFDLLMMRKQFLTLKRLAEETAAAA